MSCEYSDPSRFQYSLLGQTNGWSIGIPLLVVGSLNPQDMKGSYYNP